MTEPAAGAVNVDKATVVSFGEEWSRFEQADLAPTEIQRMFDAYFDLFPWDRLPLHAEGFDMGCGSGRWAKHVGTPLDQRCAEPEIRAMMTSSGLEDVAFSPDLPLLVRDRLQ